MISSILLAILASLWILLRPPKKDWYIVEHRVCDDKVFARPDVPVATTINDYQKFYLDGFDMKIIETLPSSVRIWHKNGGTMYLDQNVFCDFNVAMLYFEDIKNTWADSKKGDKSAYHLFILRRVVARSRSKAVVLPPNKYDFDAINLVVFPEYYWFNGGPSGLRIESERG